MSRPPVILTPFGEYEVAIRGIAKTCDERQAAITASAAQLSAASDAVEDARGRALTEAWRVYQAAIKASN